MAPFIYSMRTALAVDDNPTSLVDVQDTPWHPGESPEHTFVSTWYLVNLAVHVNEVLTHRGPLFRVMTHLL